MNIGDLLERMIKEGASDGFITAGAPLSIKVDGQIYPITGQPVTEDEVFELIISSMRPEQEEEFREEAKRLLDKEKQRRRKILAQVRHEERFLAMLNAEHVKTYVAYEYIRQSSRYGYFGGSG